MGFHEYWINTFLSTTTEAQVAGIVLVVFGIAAYIYPDSQDSIAVLAAVGLLLIIIGFFGFPFILEWHYWLIGGILLSIAIFVIDDVR